MFTIPRGFVYEPADLGFNDIAIGATATVAGNILPLLARGSFTRLSVIIDTGPSAATPFNVALGAGAWSPGTAGGSTSPAVMGNFSTFLSNIPNNPRIKHAVFGNVGATTGGLVNGGTVLGQGVANVLTAPFFALRIQNADAGTGATNVTVWVTLHE